MSANILLDSSARLDIRL